MNLNDAPYLCPRCGKSLPKKHKPTFDSDGDQDGWRCKDGFVVWVWGGGWKIGKRPFKPNK